MSDEAPQTALLALVTGAARGIGAAIAERLANEGYRLELTDCLGPELEAVAERLSSKTAVHSSVLDLRDRSAMSDWLTATKEREPQLDVLIHNAGIGGPDPEDDAEALDHLDQVMEVNGAAFLRLVKGLHPTIRRDGRGRIVVIASVLGKMGVPGFSAYCASKAAAIGLARGMALDLARDRITVNAICPGWTDTAMAQQGFEALATFHDDSPELARTEVERGLPLGRIVQPDEVAGLAAFLVGPDAGAMSGQAITMSAGDLQR